jgi:hypothetical protein
MSLEDVLLPCGLDGIEKSRLDRAQDFSGELFQVLPDRLGGEHKSLQRTRSQQIGYACCFLAQFGANATLIGQLPLADGNIR